jgi:hypothetical protein
VAERRLLLGALIVTLTACGDSEPAPREDPPAGAASVSATPAPAEPEALPLTDSGLVALVRRGAGRRYHVSGETRAAGTLQLTLEDGERVVYGPAELEVEEGRFHIEFVSEPSERTQKTVYLTTADGAKQWVIAIPAESTQIRFREP